MPSSRHMETFTIRLECVCSVIPPDQRVCWNYSCSRTGSAAAQPRFNKSKEKEREDTESKGGCHCIIIS